MNVENKIVSQEDINSIKKAVKAHIPVDFYCYTLTPEQKNSFSTDS